MTTNPSVHSVDDPREISGWTMYDWAISAFSTTVGTVFLGPYVTGLAEQAAVQSGGLLYLGNVAIRPDSLFAFGVSASVLLQVSFLPILGALADYSNLRKRLLILFSTIGALATLLMFFITAGGHWFAVALFIIANLAFGGSVVFYNAYLPDIASPERRDHVSAAGFAMGYLGGGLLLLLNLIMFMFRDRLGMDEALVSRISLASAGLWWLGFSLITFRRLRTREKMRALPENETYLTIGFTQLSTLLEFPRKWVATLLLLPLAIPVLLFLGLPPALALLPGIGPILVLVIFIARKARTLPEAMKYLVAYLLYNDGIQTVIVVASVFGAEELGIPISNLALIILMIQFVAFLGAYAFSYLARLLGSRNAIILSLVIWSGAVIYAFFGMKNQNPVPGLGLPQAELEFWLLGMVIALVLGGSQALSRSLFSLMIPKDQEAEFFSFYEVSERGTSWMGTFIFGAVNQAFGSLRLGVLSVIFFFVAGLVLLLFVNVDTARAQAANVSSPGLAPAD
jgi:UMF1 family MFS transporter